MRAKVGDKIRILHMDDPSGSRYINRTGEVTYIDSMGQLHGTWGGLAIIPEIDEYEIIND